MWDPCTTDRSRKRRISSIDRASNVEIVNARPRKRVKLRICTELDGGLDWAPWDRVEPGQWTSYTFSGGYALVMARNGVLWTFPLLRQKFMALVWRLEEGSILQRSGAVDGQPVSPSSLPTVEQMSLSELEELEEFAKKLGLDKL